MTASDTTRASGQESGGRIDTTTLPEPPGPDGDWWVTTDSARAEFVGAFAEAALLEERDDPTGRAETFPIREDGAVPLCLYARAADTQLNTYVEMSPEEAERLAAMLVEQAAVARDRRGPRDR